MTIIAGYGLRPGTRFWRGPDKYDYHVNRSKMSGGRVSLRCTEYYLQKCCGRASVRRDGKGFRQTQYHNHDPDKYKLEARAFRYALMERCKSGDHTPFKSMYHEERRRLRISRQAAARVPVVTLRSSMRRARLLSRPLIPRSLKALDKILRDRRYRALSKTLDGRDSIYVGRAGSASSRTISLLFASKRRLKYLKKVKKIICDATFSPVPRGMKASQVWTISTVRRHHTIPLVRILMRKRTANVYQAALEKLKAVAPWFQPSEIITDFEGAEQKALSNAFPNATLHGCLFHYAKDVGGQARKLRMTRLIKKNDKARSLVRQLGVVPLLPFRFMKKGYNVICKRTIRWGLSQKMLPLLQYWVTTWWPKRHVLSVSGCADRTSNASESDNLMLQVSVRQKHPNVWDFMDGVLDMEDSSQQDIITMDRARKVARMRKVSAVANDERIKNLTADLLEGHISVGHFLKEASYTIVEALNKGLNGGKKKKRKKTH